MYTLTDNIQRSSIVDDTAQLNFPKVLFRFHNVTNRAIHYQYKSLSGVIVFELILSSNY